jgi:hypothetical protein
MEKYNPSQDYKSKYLKYKNKYVNLKNKYDTTLNNSPNTLDTNIEYFNTLKKLYPSCQIKSNESTCTNTTYGEMDYPGIEKLNQILNPTGSVKYFIDVGSGRGKLPCWFAGLDPIIKSIGIEIVQSRCADASGLKNQLAMVFPNIVSKIELLCGCVSNYNLDTLTQSSPNVLIWISNLCFDSDTNDKVFTQILNQIKPGTIICCSQEPPKTIDSNTKNKLVFDKNIQIKMSWSESSNVYVYYVR